MLALTRRIGEEVVIGDPRNPLGVIRIMEIHGDKVRLSFDFPKDTQINRRELAEQKAKQLQSQDATGQNVVSQGVNGQNTTDQDATSQNPKGDAANTNAPSRKPSPRQSDPSDGYSNPNKK